MGAASRSLGVTERVALGEKYQDADAADTATMAAIAVPGGDTTVAAVAADTPQDAPAIATGRVRLVLAALVLLAVIAGLLVWGLLR